MVLLLALVGEQLTSKIISPVSQHNILSNTLLTVLRSKVRIPPKIVRVSRFFSVEIEILANEFRRWEDRADMQIPTLFRNPCEL